MADYPAMPLWTDAYLGDTLHLSLEEHGAYLKMLMIAWRDASCRLPDDDRRIATMLGVTTTRWRARLRPALEPFWIIEDGWWRNKKLEKVREMVTKSSEKQRAKAQQRWGDKSLSSNENDKAAADPAGMPQSMQPKPKPKPESKPPCAPSERSPPTGGKRRATRLPDDWWPSEADVAYAQRQGIPDERIQRVAEDFRDYWHTKAGQGATKTDWSRTWQKWTRTEAERLPKQRPNGYGRHQPENYLDSALRDVCGAFDAQSGDRPSPGELYEDDDSGEGDATGVSTGGGELLPPRRRQGGG